MCLYMIDTEKEKSIELGISWPYDKLEPYECIISEEYGSQYSLAEGDELVFTIGMTDLWNTLRYQYNQAARNNSWHFMPEFTWQNATLGIEEGITQFNCTVKGVAAKTYGKFRDSDAQKQIVMEYEYFLDTLANTTTFNSTFIKEQTAEQFKAWILATPDLAYQYAGEIVSNLPSPRYVNYQDSDFQEI